MESSVKVIWLQNPRLEAKVKVILLQNEGFVPSVKVVQVRKRGFWGFGKFFPVKISWEDIGRYANSVWGDRISDVGIWVREKE